jgi:exopolysaccharide biosynthesis protein
MKKTKQTTSKKLTNKRLFKLIPVLAFGLIGSFFIVNSFAETTNTSAKCTTSTTNSKNSTTSTTPPCVKVGTSGAMTYWMDNTIPNKKIHVLRIDLNNNRIKFRASQISERQKTPTEFAKMTGAIAAINGDFFYKDNNYITNGLAIGSGNTWPFTIDKPDTTFIACTDNRDCFIDDSNSARQVDPKVHTSLVSGYDELLTPNFRWALKPGDPGCGPVEHTCSNTHPRTAVALSADRKVMWWVVVEGRQPTVSGLSLYDLTSVIQRLGATWAINLDGGGSSGMVINGKLVNNRPSDEPVERKVANSLGIIELPAPTPAK